MERPLPTSGGTAATEAPHGAGLARRLIALVYEALLLAAVLIVGSLPFVLLGQALDRTVARPLFQAHLLTLAGAYFVWQWAKGGRTLAMQTWRMRLVTRDGARPDWRIALRRYLAAVPGVLLFGIGFLWALVDREGLFLHDRLAGTRIVMSEE